MRQAIFDATRLADQQFVALVSGAGGGKSLETRDRVFAGFNTPLLPEILICTAVGQGRDTEREAEGHELGKALIPLPNGLVDDLRVKLHVWEERGVRRRKGRTAQWQQTESG